MQGLQSIGSPNDHTLPPGQEAVKMAPHALSSTREAPAAGPANVASRPVRVASMLLDRVNDGDPEVDSSSDKDDQDTSSMDHDAATARSSDDDRLSQVATELPARAVYIAVATAYTMDTTTTSHEVVSSAATAYDVVDVSRTCDDRLGWQTSVMPDRAVYDASIPCDDKLSAGPCPQVDDCTPCRAGSMLPAGDAQAPATTATVPIDVD
uniref:Uncharacterized protein n=1 Tax=Peronospora matthiolae TaxID=2874970 RepID=A0AAV1VBZ8_9STRA